MSLTPSLTPQQRAGRVEFPSVQPKPMSRTALADVLTADFADGITRGRMRSIAGKSSTPAAVRGVIEARLAATSGRPPSTSYRHPARFIPESTTRDARDSDDGAQRRPAHLTESDFRWLDRLPQDPAAISYDDARHLLKLAKLVKPEADRRLIASYVEPVVAHHDRQAALANARHVLESTPTFGTSLSASERNHVEAALAEVIAAEVPGLQADEARRRASVELAGTFNHVHQERLETRARAAEVVNGAQA